MEYERDAGCIGATLAPGVGSDLEDFKPCATEDRPERTWSDSERVAELADPLDDFLD